MQRHTHFLSHLNISINLKTCTQHKLKEMKNNKNNNKKL